MCNEEITEPLSSNFAEPHITANPGHLEYRIIIEMPSANVPDNEPTLVFDNTGNIRLQSCNNITTLLNYMKGCIVYILLIIVYAITGIYPA